MDLFTGLSALESESDTISPLPPVLRDGLTAVSALASISLLSSSLLFAHLTFKLVRYSIKRAHNKSKMREFKREWSNQAHNSMDLGLGLNKLHYGSSRKLQRCSSAEQLQQKEAMPPPNQFVILLYNLLLADMHQALAFFVNVVWVARDGVFVRTSACWIQGWFVSNGDLASSCFIATIALHTYLTLVREYKPPEWALNAWIVIMWVFVYGVTIAGITSTSNGKNHGGYYVRAAAWCWINAEYDNLRLVTHYLYIFIALALTPVTYTAIFCGLRHRQQREARRDTEACNSLEDDSPRPEGSLLHEIRVPMRKSRSGPTLRSEHHPAFLIYPLIYVVCTMPLALGRVATLANLEVPYWYFCMAGALITSNGWLDVLLWGTTRHTIVLGPLENSNALGLETFTFVRTPPDREFGNIVWVQGATANDRGDGRTGAARRSRMWWALVRTFFFSGVETQIGDESGHASMQRRNRRQSGILSLPGVKRTYSPGHVKYTGDAESVRHGPEWWRRKRGSSVGGISVQKDTVVSVVTVEKGGLEAGSRPPTAK